MLIKHILFSFIKKLNAFWQRKKYVVSDLSRFSCCPQHLKLDPLSRRHFPLELPKLNLGVPTHTLPFPAPTPSHRGSLPAISKCHSRLNKVTFTLSQSNYPLKMKLLFVLIVFSSEAQRWAAASEELLHASCARAPPAGLLTPAHASRAQATLTLHIIQ